MSSLNKVMLIGNLGADPEMKYMPSGEAVVNLSIATSERWKDKQTGEQVEKTEWHRVAYFGRIAEVCGEYLRKGSKIYVEGSLQTRKWQDKDGNDRYSTDVKGRTMTMLDSKGQGGNQNTGGSQSGAGAGGADSGSAGSPAPGPDDFDDDIPF